MLPPPNSVPTTSTSPSSNSTSTATKPSPPRQPSSRKTTATSTSIVNNAGIVDPADGPPSTANLAAVEHVFHVNFFQTIALTQVLLPLLRKAPSARIVNVSSGLASLTLHSDPNFPFGAFRIIGYCGSKAALNIGRFTVLLANELRDTNIKVNSADPGYTATDINNNSGPQTIEEGAAETIRLALLPDDGPTGTFSDSKGPEPW